MTTSFNFQICDSAIWLVGNIAHSDNICCVQQFLIMCVCVMCVSVSECASEWVMSELVCQRRSSSSAVVLWNFERMGTRLPGDCEHNPAVAARYG